MGRHRGPLLVLLLVVLPLGAALGGYLWSGSHPILPGLRGCEYVRHTDARSACVRDFLRGELEGREVGAGLGRIERLAKDRRIVAVHCHLALHPIGERAGRRTARRGQDAPAIEGGGNCRNGYMHGLMIGYVDERGDDLGTVLPTLCTQDGQDEFACSHVVGHLLARASSDADPQRSLADGCATGSIARDVGAVALEDGTPGVSEVSGRECVRGGYMELALIDEQPPLGEWAARCRRAPAATREECYAWLPPIAAYRKLPQEAAAARCQALDRGGHHADCVAGVSRALAPGSTCAVFSRAGDAARCERAQAARTTLR